MAELPMLPTDEQLAQWESDWFSERENADVLLIQAFQAGADAQLEACVEWVAQQGWTWTCARLRAAMRPKPPSLKQRALEALDRMPQHNETETIRRALEALSNDI